MLLCWVIIGDVLIDPECKFINEIIEKNLLIKKFCLFFVFCIRYHHTLSAPLLYALREALANVCREGIQHSIERHINVSNRFQMGIKALGLEMYVDNVSQRFPTINVIKVPDGINSQLIIDYALNK